MSPTLLALLNSPILPTRHLIELIIKLSIVLKYIIHPQFQRSKYIFKLHSSNRQFSVRIRQLPATLLCQSLRQKYTSRFWRED